MRTLEEILSDNKMKPDISEELTLMLINMIEEKRLSNPSSLFSLAISGGGSPMRLFGLWSQKFRDSIPWSRISLFWTDERAVPPEDSESNYGMAKSNLLERVPIPGNQIYRIEGESDPQIESVRYSSLLKSVLPHKDGFPVFDLIILGIGVDGHTASIFPGQDQLYTYDLAYAPSLNPYSGQKRVTMTGKTILNSNKSVFYLTGEEKRETVDMVIKNSGESRYPASFFLKQLTISSIFWDRL